MSTDVVIYRTSLDMLVLWDYFQSVGFTAQVWIVSVVGLLPRV